MVNDKKTLTAQVVFPLAVTAILCLIIHGYRFANDMFSHDSLLEIVQNDAAWQIALGRFMQPLLVFLRGNICSPWLLCILQTLWLSLSVYLLTDILQIRNKSAILAVSGVVVSSEALIILNTSYLIDSDMYAFALFASIFGVWCFKKRTLAYSVIGIISIVISLATYQAYISVALTLMVILSILRLCSFSVDFKIILKQLIYYAVILLLGAIIYYGSWQVIRRILGIWAADSYNGMADMGHYENGELIASIQTTYKNVFLYFFEPSIMSNISFRGIKLRNIWKYAIIASNIAVILTIPAGIISAFLRQTRIYKPKKWQLIIRCILTALLLLLFPLACNFACLLSKGMEHPLMMFGATMIYVFAAAITVRIQYWNNISAAAGSTRPSLLKKSSVRILAVLLGMIVWVHFIYANQMYFKKSLQEKAAYSLISRIITDVEDIPGYTPGVTPVAISGYFESSPYLIELQGFEDLRPYSVGKTSLTYPGLDYSMINYYLSIDMNLIRIDGSIDAVRQMPSYPEAGSIAFIDDILVVKMSDS